MFSRIRVSATLIFILAVFCLMQIVSSGLSFNSFRQDANNLYQVDTSGQQRDALSQSWASLLSARVTLSRAGTRAALSLPRDQVTSLMAGAQRDLDSADKTFQRFLAIPRMTPEGEAMTKEIKASYDNYHHELAQLIVYLENYQLQDFLDAPTQKSQDNFLVQYNRWMLHISGIVEHAKHQSHDFYTQSKWIFAGAVTLSLLMTLLALGWLKQALITPLTRMRDHFSRIASGNLGGNIEQRGSNEIGQLFTGLRDMQSRLAETVVQVREGSETMQVGIREIASGNNDLSARTEQQASSLAETAASMEQLTATVTANADNARQASQLARDASATAHKGGSLTGNVVATMHQIATSSKKIADITSVIDGIAFQTNILALNAAVEAARAGEQGRGFAVVAGEVRNLAQRSAVAAREIKEVMAETSTLVAEGVAVTDSTATSIISVVDLVGELADAMDEIALASGEQMQGISQVHIAVSEMDGVTQQNATLVQASAVATGLLEEQVHALTSTISRFRIAEEFARPAPSSLKTPARALKPKTAGASADEWVSF